MEVFLHILQICVELKHLGESMYGRPPPGGVMVNTLDMSVVDHWFDL